MTKVMYDGVTPSRIPSNATMVAAYINGPYGDSYNEAVKLFPNAEHIAISIDPALVGQVLDCEKYDARPDQCPSWVKLSRAAGFDPTVYMSQSVWPTVRQAFLSQGVAEPHYWVASYASTPDPTIPDGAVAHQYQNTPGYDISSVIDDWPNPVPVNPVKVPTTKEEVMALTAIIVRPNDSKGKGGAMGIVDDNWQGKTVKPRKWSGINELWNALPAASRPPIVRMKTQATYDGLVDTA